MDLDLGSKNSWLTLVPLGMSTQVPLDSDHLLDKWEALEYLRIGLRTLDRHIKNGLPHMKFGRTVRFRRGDLDSWMEGRKIGG